MNKTISVYELLGLIKDGKEPKKVKYNNRTYEFKEIEEGTGYVYESGIVKIWLSNEIEFDISRCLNEKVEIIEEDKPIIENINKLNYQQIGTYQLDNNDILGFIKSLNEQFTKYGRKINEIIDYINRKENNDKH